MVIREPFPFALSGGFSGRRLPPRLAVAIGVSVAIHLAAGTYVIFQRFDPGAPTVETGTPPIQLITFKKRPAQEPVAPRRAKAPVALHPPLLTPPVSVQTLDATPIPAPRAEGLAPTDEIQGQANVTLVPDPPVITSPSWLRKPGTREFERFYPPSAVHRNIQGSVTLACSVTVAGAVVACHPTAETPAGEGFGEAAVKLSRYFRMSPPTRDGRPTEAQVNIPIRFTLG